jgi:hypothetical protein
MSHLHSSALPRYAPIPKTVNGRTRAEEKHVRDNAKDAEEARCYALVDARDELRDRVTGKLLSKRGGLTTRVERHHMKGRGAGGKHETSNVVTVSPETHAEIEVKGTLRLSGDADARDDRGRLCGVKVERLQNDVWRVVGWV